MITKYLTLILYSSDVNPFIDSPVVSIWAIPVEQISSRLDGVKEEKERIRAAWGIEPPQEGSSMVLAPDGSLLE